MPFRFRFTLAAAQGDEDAARKLRRILDGDSASSGSEEESSSEDDEHFRSSYQWSNLGGDGFGTGLARPTPASPVHHLGEHPFKSINQYHGSEINKVKFNGVGPIGGDASNTSRGMHAVLNESRKSKLRRMRSRSPSRIRSRSRSRSTSVTSASSNGTNVGDSDSDESESSSKSDIERQFGKDVRRLPPVSLATVPKKPILRRPAPLKARTEEPASSPLFNRAFAGYNSSTTTKNSLVTKPKPPYSPRPLRPQLQQQFRPLQQTSRSRSPGNSLGSRSRDRAASPRWASREPPSPSMRPQIKSIGNSIGRRPSQSGIWR